MAVSSIPASDDVLDPAEPLYDLQKVAQLLQVPVTKVQQQLRDGHLVALRRDRELLIPKAFFTDEGRAAKHLSGLLAVLRDGGFSETDILRWLFTADPTLELTRDGVRETVSNARPVDALHAHQSREILRRAQALAY